MNDKTRIERALCFFKIIFPYMYIFLVDYAPKAPWTYILGSQTDCTYMYNVPIS